MCELAFNVTGEGFEPPETTAFWRVRRLKPGGRGTPEVMFGADGAPLMIAVDTDLAEFRQQVKGEPGRYRLDPVDEHQRPCDAATPAYLQLTEESEEPAGFQAAAAPHYDIVKELVRANTEMVLSITEKFSAVMDSAATLLRAADGAGLPARTPPPVVAAPAPVDDGDEDEEDDEYEDEAEEGEPSRGSELEGLLKQIVPVIKSLVASYLSKKSKAPAAPRNANLPAPGPASAEARPDEPEEAPQLTPEAIGHFMQVQALLTPEESRVAQSVAAELSPSEAKAWMDHLCKLSVEDAAAVVRDAVASGGAS